jgi:archaellum component FlaC
MNTQVNQNTKPVAPAEETPAATPAEETPAATPKEENVSIKSLNEQKAKLVAKIGGENPALEDFNNLTAINTAIKKMFENRQNVINEIKQNITNQEFSITDIFTVEELKTGGYVPFVEKQKKPKKASTPKARDTVNELFFIAKPSGKGARDFIYNKGRIYTEESKTVKAPFSGVSKTLIANVKTKEDLLKFVSDINKDGATKYLNTAEGQKEIRAILAHLNNGALTATELKAIA